MFFPGWKPFFFSKLELYPKRQIQKYQQISRNYAFSLKQNINSFELSDQGG